MTRVRKPSASVFAAVALLWLLFAQAVRGAAISSLAFDEGPHLAVGYATLRTGDFRLQPVHIHPPLANVLAAAPLLLDPSLPDPRTIPGWEIASLSAVTDTIVWKHSPPDGIAFAGRLPIILLAVLLGAFVFRWATDLGGRRAGLLALFLYALDPNIVAHSQVITTDMGVTVLGFVALYCCFKHQTSNVKRQMWWLVGSGAALGAALATKVSAGLLAPLLAMLILLIGPGSVARRVGRIAIMGLLAFVVVWAVYGFEIGRVPGLPFPVPAATHLKIYQSLQQHYDEGHPSFLMGMNSTRGWWFYFPVAFLIKTPLPTLILLLISTVRAARDWRLEIRGCARASGTKQVATWTLGLFPAVHFVTALSSSVDIGYRHLLPILPFLFVFIGVLISNRRVALSSSPAKSERHLVTLSLLVWYMLDAALIFPHNLAFFNALAGGSDNGYHWLVDSNLDWGQNLKELKVWLDARGISEVYISQFSPSRPEEYGIRAKLLPPSPRAEPFAPFDPAPGWYAIGATTLQGAYMPDADTFAYFRTMTLAARIGHAMFVYHVPEQPPGEWAAHCFNTSFDAEKIRAGFGRADLRVVRFDCTASWWYPGESKPGWFVYDIPWTEYFDPEYWYPGARMIYRTDSGRRLVNIYRVDTNTLPKGREMQAVAAPGDWMPTQAMSQGIGMTAPITTTGPLRFEGAYDGGALTVWRVTRNADAPLSIMAHLVDAQGRVVSGADGLGVPVEAWQVGDTIVQKHVFKTSDLAPGKYWIETGTYRLDTMERYRILQSDQVVGDRLLLASIEVKP